MTMPAVDVDHYWQHGYTVVRDVFSPEEAADLRERAVRTREHQGDLLSNPELYQVVCDARILHIARALLRDTPVYFNYSSAKFGFHGRGFHKDNADRHDQQAPDWRDPYTLLRMGIYLQDHHDHSGGLNVRHDSHRWVSTTRGKTRYTATRLGDVVIWNLRTSHAANGVRLKFARGVGVEPWLVEHLPESWLLPTEGERVALFLTYGLDDEHLERFIAYSKTRAFMIDLWRASTNVSEQAWALLRSAPVSYRDVWSEIRNEANLGANVPHVDIPY